MKNVLIILLLVNITRAFPQKQADTSYTAISTYKKEIIKYPFIKIVERPEIIGVTRIENIVYKNTGTRNLHLDAYFQKGSPLQPAVILIHGGGWKSGDKSQMHYLAQQIASHGYACFCVEYRLSHEAKYPAAVHDVKTAVKYIKHNAEAYNANPNSVAVLGCSSGGQMAALIGATNGKPEFESTDGMRQNATVQAVIDMDGIVAFHHPESQEGMAASLWLGVTCEQKPAVWDEASALTHAGKNTPPILFINSDKPRFHAGRDDLIAVLDKHKIYSEVKTIADSPHSFWFFDPWFDEIVGWSTQFLDKILK